MALKLEDKKTFVKEISEVARKSISAIAAEYRGLSVADLRWVFGQSFDGSSAFLVSCCNKIGRRTVSNHAPWIGSEPVQHYSQRSGPPIAGCVYQY